jgi:hypothetical protein
MKKKTINNNNNNNNLFAFHVSYTGINTIDLEIVR